jgi:hypothetical protein
MVIPSGVQRNRGIPLRDSIIDATLSPHCFRMERDEDVASTVMRFCDGKAYAAQTFSDLRCSFEFHVAALHSAQTESITVNR